MSSPRRPTLALCTLLLLTLAACRQQEAAPPPAPVEDAPATAGPTAERPATVPSALPPLEELVDVEATATPLPDAARPARVEIPAAGVDAEVLIVAVDEDGYLPTPDEHAGYWALSAPLGAGGNTVLVGHNRPDPRPVFQNLPRVEVGDRVTLTDQFANEYQYEVSEVSRFDVAGSAEEAERTLEYIDLAQPERVTLVTCQPEGACSERLIVVAEPVDG